MIRFLLRSNTKIQSFRFIAIRIFFVFLLLFSPLLKAQGQDSTQLNSIIERADDIATLRTLIISKGDETILRESFKERDIDKAFNIKSASKSIIGLLTGIAIEKGFIPSIDEPIGTYFPDYFEQNPDSVKEGITIRNLLTMQAGLRSTSSENYGAWVISKNWIEYTLDQEFVSEIGGRMVYSTGTSHLLSVIIAKASGMNTKRFAEKYFFDPMGISIDGWDKDPQGNYMGGNNVAIKPDDMLKIGRMLLDNGVYAGKQIVSKEWISDSFKTYTHSNYNPYGYGYQWWNQEIGGYQTFFAWGNGGQYIFMIPELDSVVVITSTTLNTTPRRSYKYTIFPLVGEEIIPMLETYSQ